MFFFLKNYLFSHWILGWVKKENFCRLRQRFFFFLHLKWEVFFNVLPVGEVFFFSKNFHAPPPDIKWCAPYTLFISKYRNWGKKKHKLRHVNEIKYEWNAPEVGKKLPFCTQHTNPMKCCSSTHHGLQRTRTKTARDHSHFLGGADNKKQQQQFLPHSPSLHFRA